MRSLVLLDLFCGRWGWSRAFVNRGWHCIGVDLIEPPDIPAGCEFVCGDILNLRVHEFPAGKIFYWQTNGDHVARGIDAIVVSSPCEEFSVHGMKHFHPNPKYPENGVRLFEHTRILCKAAGVPYVMENVRAAQQFVGNAVHHCGPFYLWGNAVPPLMYRGITKGTHDIPGVPINRSRYRRAGKHDSRLGISRKDATAELATIPPELANTVAEYFERVLGKQAVSA